MLPDPIRKFVEIFAKLPGIGPRQATRIAFHMANQGKNSVSEAAKAVAGLGNLSVCASCFTATLANSVCAVCSNPKRNPKIIAVVEKETDLTSIEKTGKFEGRYLVLGELKKDGILNEMQKLRLKTLKNADEIIIAINPTTYGDINAEIISQELKNSSKKLTRLGRGIPTGGEIEFADEATLESALEHRK
ncbi:MAG: recombination protein RecR [Candidatus Harrisonbacteria bacterium]|nr:recombination protein RecR [Candidatus Harrisonbacteria bacterium]